MSPHDIGRVGEMWLEASIKAHGFVPPAFWRSNHKIMTEELLPQAECFVHLTGERIDGFSAIIGNFVHGLFVEPESRRRGIGTALLSHWKESHQTLRLHVYQQNPDAIRFYSAHGFHVTGEAVCPPTECAEFEMEWTEEPGREH